MKKLTKVFKGVIKSINEENHIATVTVSTASVDRDQEVILPSAFTKRLNTYLAHPIMLASHNPYRLENQIGEAKEVQINKEGLDVTFEWYAGKGNPQADWAWFLATRKIAAFSVGMMIHGYQEGKRLQDGSFENGIRGTFTDVELLEISQVLIPSNRDAMMSRLGKAQHEEAELLEMAVKSIKDEEWPVEKNIVTKPEETENTIRIPIRNKDDFKDDSIRTVTLSEEQGITALIGKLKSGEDDSTHIITVIFDKDKGWTMEKAKKWVEDHKDDLKFFIDLIQRDFGIFKEIIMDIVKEHLDKKTLGEGPKALPAPTKEELTGLFTGILKGLNLI